LRLGCASARCRHRRDERGIRDIGIVAMREVSEISASSRWEVCEISASSRWEKSGLLRGHGASSHVLGAGMSVCEMSASSAVRRGGARGLRSVRQPRRIVLCLECLYARLRDVNERHIVCSAAAHRLVSWVLACVCRVSALSEWKRRSERVRSARGCGASSCVLERRSYSNCCFSFFGKHRHRRPLPVATMRGISSASRL